jgi:hypothetical protein
MVGERKASETSSILGRFCTATIYAQRKSLAQSRQSILAVPGSTDLQDAISI